MTAREQPRTRAPAPRTLWRWYELAPPANSRCAPDPAPSQVAAAALRTERPRERGASHKPIDTAPPNARRVPRMRLRKIPCARTAGTAAQARTRRSDIGREMDHRDRLLPVWQSTIDRVPARRAPEQPARLHHLRNTHG